MNGKKIAGGVAVLALFGGVLFAAKRHLIHLPFFQKPKPLVMAAGTKIPLVLADNLSSGGSKEGQDVTFLLTDDIKAGKEVVLERGSKIFATVTRSRGATALTALGNQPARLEISFKPVTIAGGLSVKLGSKSGSTFSFTQENTSKRKDAASLDRLWDTPEGKKALEDFKASTTDGGLRFPDPEAMQKVADGMGLEKTKKLLSSPRSDKAMGPEKIFEAASKGDLLTLSGFDQVLALQALGEIGSVTRAIDDKVRGVFKGNNIEAQAGTPVTVQTLEKVVIPKS